MYNRSMTIFKWGKKHIYLKQLFCIKRIYLATYSKNYTKAYQINSYKSVHIKAQIISKNSLNFTSSTIEIATQSSVTSLFLF